MNAANIVTITLIILIGLAVVIAIYKFFKHYFSDHTYLDPHDQSVKRRQTFKTVFTILASLAVIAAAFAIYYYFL